MNMWSKPFRIIMAVCLKGKERKINSSPSALLLPETDNPIFYAETEHELINEMLLQGAYTRKSRYNPMKEDLSDYSGWLWWEESQTYGKALVYTKRLVNTSYIRYILPFEPNVSRETLYEEGNNEEE